MPLRPFFITAALGHDIYPLRSLHNGREEERGTCGVPMQGEVRGRTKGRGAAGWPQALIALAISGVLAGCHYSVVKRLDLWRKKLRLHTPSSYGSISVEQMIALQPGCPFKQSEVAEIDRQERRSVALEGYLIRVEQLADGKTYAHLLRRGDIHLEIAPAPDFTPEGGSAQRVIC